MKLVACMIVKNEEDLLPQCLSSISNFVDEVIAVDTGSEDSTVSILKSFGAKVYHSPWRNDFSFHRNESISYAEEGSWILIIDADEKLCLPSDMTKADIHRWFESTPPEVNTIALMVHDIQGGKMMMCCNSARIFRKGKVRYEGVVHNQPIFTGPCGLCHFMILEHYGYGLSEDKMDAKFVRTRDLLLKRYKENNKDYQVGFYLCQLYGQHGDIEDSILWGEKYLKNKEEMGAEFNSSIYFTMVRNYQIIKDHTKAYEVLRLGLRQDPIHPDLGLALSDQGTFTNEPHIVAEGARRFLKGYKHCMENPSTMEGKFYFTLREDALSLMIYRLCISCLQEGVDAFSLFQANRNITDPDMLHEFITNLGSLGMTHLQKQLEEKNMGGKPSKGTKADKRLTENKPKSNKTKKSKNKNKNNPSSSNLGITSS